MHARVRSDTANTLTNNLNTNTQPAMSRASSCSQLRHSQHPAPERLTTHTSHADRQSISSLSAHARLSRSFLGSHSRLAVRRVSVTYFRITQLLNRVAVIVLRSSGNNPAFQTPRPILFFPVSFGAVPTVRSVSRRRRDFCRKRSFAR